MPLSNELAHSMQRVLAGYVAGTNAYPELDLLAPLIDHQALVSRVPEPGMLLIEQCRTREGSSLFVFPFAGRLVHEGLATLVAWRIARDTPITFTLSMNDYGFELLSPEPFEVTEPRVRSWLSTEGLAEDLLSGINLSESAKRQFRDIARIAGLVFQGYPGAGKSTRQIQASSGLIYDVLTRYDEDNLLLDQAQREVLDAQLESQRMRAALESIAQRQIQIETTERLSPFAFPLWAERLQSQIMSSETWRDRVQRMADRLNAGAQRSRAAR
jgi:ATP-dependent Lhr-like helicase